MTTEAEIGLMWLQVKEHWQPPRAREGKTRIHPRVSSGTQPTPDTLTLGGGGRICIF